MKKKNQINKKNVLLKFVSSKKNKIQISNWFKNRRQRDRAAEHKEQVFYHPISYHKLKLVINK